MINGVKQPSELGYQLILVTEGFGVNHAWAPYVDLQLVAGVEAEVATFHLCPTVTLDLNISVCFSLPCAVPELPS